MKHFDEIIKNLEASEDIILSRIHEEAWVNMDECDELFLLRNKLFKMRIQINDMRKTYGI